LTNKLAEYGHTFQVKSIACLMTDIGFMGQIYDILDESHFDNDALKWVVKECKLYYNEYKKPITLDVFKVKTNDKHGGAFGSSGGVFISIQHWLNGVSPHCVALDYTGVSGGSDHMSKVKGGDAYVKNNLTWRDVATKETRPPYFYI